MKQSISVVCPSCNSALKISKPSLLGKRVACPACGKPVLIEAPTEIFTPPTSSDRESAGHGSFRDEAPKRQSPKQSATTEQQVGPKAMEPDLDTVLLADDDPPGRPLAKPSADDSTRAPSPKPRSSGVWKKMQETETAEFEAMLVDTDEEPDEPTVELPFMDAPPSSGSIRKRGKGGKDSSEHDEMLLETNAEQDERTAEMSEQPRGRKQKGPSKSKRAASHDPDDMSVEDSELESEAFLSRAPRPPRVSAAGAPLRSRAETKYKVPMIIGAFVVSSLLMGLLLYSTSRAKAPVPLPDSASGGALAAAEVKDDSTATPAEKDETAEPTADKSKGNGGKPTPPAVATDQSGQAAGDGGFKAPGVAARNSSRAPLGAAGLPAIGSGLGAGSSKETAAADRVPRDGAILGRQIPPFTATAVDKTTFQSADCKQKIMVVAFLGVECPLANLYFPRLVELAKNYKGKSVGFLAINANAQDTLDDVQKQARANRATFPVLKDAGNAVAALFGAERTPEVFVLDATRTVRYHGMIDDQYGYRQRRSQPTKNYVVDAVDAMLSGGTLAVAETPLQGCHIGRVTKASETAHTSFYRDVLPVLQNRCQQCHRKGEIGPFALKEFAEVRDWAPTIREAVAERRMPPWPADPHFGKFSNDISLTDLEIETITKWVDEGCPEGDPSQKPPEKKFVDGWNIGKPDRVFTMERPFHVPATGVVEYQNIYASPVFMQDTYVQAVECRFGNRSVVHHMLVLLDFPKDRSNSQDGLVKGFFAAGAPGSTYFVFPKGYAKKIPKGARLRFQMHYTPNGTAADDQSRFGIVLAKEPKEREVQTYALGKLDINIPAGNPDHMETATQNVNAEVILTTLMPHLHVRGKSFTFSVVWPNGKKETLLSVPRWDFNWQPQYQLAKPIVLPKNSQIIVEAHWDNSADNPNNILPLVDVQFGEQTFDEMFIGYVNFIPKALADASRTHGRRRGG